MSRTLDGGYVYRGVHVYAGEGKWRVFHEGRVHVTKDQVAARRLIDKVLKESSGED